MKWFALQSLAAHNIHGGVICRAIDYALREFARRFEKFYHLIRARRHFEFMKYKELYLRVL